MAWDLYNLTSCVKLLWTLFSFLFSPPVKSVRKVAIGAASQDFGEDQMELGM